MKEMSGGNSMREFLTPHLLYSKRIAKMKKTISEALKYKK